MKVERLHASNWAIVDGLRAKTLTIGKRRTQTPKYTSIQIVEMTPIVGATK